MTEERPADAKEYDGSNLLLSVVIVSWNDWPVLQRCLKSVAGGLPPDSEILVVDNGSKNSPPDNIEELFPDVRIHRNGVNLGHTKAVNIGFANAVGQFILLLDSDTEILDKAIMRLVAFMRDRPEIGVATGRVFNSDGSIQESARNLPNPLNGLFGRQTFLTRVFPNNPVSRKYLARENLSATEPFEVEQVGAQCMILRRDVLDAVGNWDERFFGYWVDTDWCAGVMAAGRTIFCVPTAQIIHHENNARAKKKGAKRIWDFHLGAYKYYTKRHCFGAADPRSILAGAALFSRAVLLITADAMKKTNLTANEIPNTTTRN